MKKILCFVGALSVLCLFSHTVFAQDMQAAYGLLGGVIPVQEAVSADDLQGIIVAAAKGRDWLVRSQDNQKVVIFQQNKKWISQLTFIYNGHDISVYSNTTREGKVKIPDSWISNLHKDIAKKLKALTVPVK